MGHVGDGKELLLKGRTNHPLCWAAFPVAEGGSLWWAGTKRVDWDDTSFFGCAVALEREFQEQKQLYSEYWGCNYFLCFPKNSSVTSAWASGPL